MAITMKYRPDWISAGAVKKKNILLSGGIAPN